MPIYEGLTVDEAIQEGLHALGLNKDQAVIDVLDEGKRFLGIGKRMPAYQLKEVLRMNQNHHRISN